MRSRKSGRRIVTFHGESRDFSEVTKPMFLLTTRKTVIIGTRNVQTMWEAERTGKIASEMRRYNLALLEISETYWT